MDHDAGARSSGHPADRDVSGPLEGPDLLGEALRDHLLGRRRNALMLRVAPDAWPVDLDELLGRTPLTALETAVLDRCRGRVLEIGAGAGRHSLVLQAAGHDHLALDISPGAVEVMRERGVRRASCTDWRTFFRGADEQFDTVLILGRGLGLLASVEGLRSFLRLAGRVLAPDGQILGDCANPLRPGTPSAGRPEGDASGSPAFRQREMFLDYGGRQGRHFLAMEIAPAGLRSIAAEEGWQTELVRDAEVYAVRLTRLADP